MLLLFPVSLTACLLWDCYKFLMKPVEIRVVHPEHIMATPPFTLKDVVDTAQDWHEIINFKEGE